MMPPVLWPPMVSDVLDRALVLCRRHAGFAASQLALVHAINTALLFILYDILDPASFWKPWLRLPLAAGNPLLLLDLLASVPATPGLPGVALLGIDIALVVACLRALFLRRFAGDVRVPERRGARALFADVRALLLPSTVLLGGGAITALPVRLVIPNDLLISILLAPSIERALGQLLAAMLFFSFGVLLTCRFALAPLIGLLEPGGGLRSLRRSWQLSAGAPRMVFRLMLVLDGITIALVALPLVLMILDRLIPWPLTPLFVLARVAALLISGLALISVPLQAAATVVLAQALYAAREGHDLAGRIAALGAGE